MPETDFEPDEQDQSEVFDEDNQDPVEGGAPLNEFRTFEELPDVLDVTAAAGDSDEDEFDEDDLDIDDSLSIEGVEPSADPLFGADSPRVADSDAQSDDLAAPDDVELVPAGLLEDVQGAQGSLAHWESKRLSDEDIEDLGYGPDEDKES